MCESRKSSFGCDPRGSSIDFKSRYVACAVACGRHVEQASSMSLLLCALDASCPSAFLGPQRKYQRNRSGATLTPLRSRSQSPLWVISVSNSAFLSSSCIRAVQSAWDRVQAAACGSHLRESPKRVVFFLSSKNCVADVMRLFCSPCAWKFSVFQLAVEAPVA